MCVPVWLKMIPNPIDGLRRPATRPGLHPTTTTTADTRPAPNGRRRKPLLSGNSHPRRGPYFPVAGKGIAIGSICTKARFTASICSTDSRTASATWCDRVVDNSPSTCAVNST